MLALIGYRGTGKTTVAQQLALRLGCDWVDADVEIELQAGKSIAAIFSEQGENAFRDLETQMLRQLIARQTGVLALGGGVILRPENRTLLQACGQVVWLTASVDTLANRIADDPLTAARRPNLTVQGGRDEIAAVLAARHELYRQCADVQVDTEGKSPSQIAAEIIDHCQSR